jgi:shikimate kinase
MHPDSSPRFPQRIVLVGFMGAGKSTIGPLLANRLGWRFIDADHYLQARTGSTIADLFLRLGEAGFRALEAEAFAELSQENELVLALGGGALETESTRDLLAASHDACMVFLKAPLQVLIERCESQPGAAVRPVLRQRDALSQRFHARLPHYERAQISIDTVGLEPAEVVDRILPLLIENTEAVPLSRKVRAT